MELFDEDNINSTNQWGETALLRSLMCSSSLFAKKLILHGADVNLSDDYGRTPLLEAVRSRNYDIARLLIENGADVNLADEDEDTPLHVAVRMNDFEMVSMLLYYDADTSYTDESESSPFVLAVDRDADECIKEVLSQYETFDYNVALVDESGWMIPPTMYKFLNSNLNNCLKYLKLLFSSDRINDMIHCCYDYFQPNPTSNYHGESILKLLIRSFHNCQLNEDELLPFVCVILSSGIEVTLADVAYLYNHYGNNKILNLLFHMNVSDLGYSHVPPLLHLIWYVREDIEEFLIDHYGDHEHYIWVQDIHNVLAFHTPSSKLKEVLFQRIRQVFDNEEELKEKIRGLTVPSLTELSRDASRKAICEKCEIKNSYNMFYAVLNNLPVPNFIKDLIKFKVPVNQHR